MKVLKVMLGLLALVVLLILAAGTYVKFALPNVGEAPKLSIQSTPEKIERGRYLANHVTVCMDCHSRRDWTLFAGPMKSEGIGGGGERFDQKMGFPGEFYAPNITPAKLNSWTDGEIFRAITAGVNKDGKALFPLMASHRFGQMDKEDIYAIITYIRTLKPVENTVPPGKLDFPVNFLVNTMPKKAAFTTLPKAGDSVLYGGYLVNAAGCVDCHSKMDKGSIVPGSEFGGGMEFNFPQGVVRSPNITADVQTGIGSWTKEQFVQRFKQYAAAGYQAPSVSNGMNTPMPWNMYAGMNDQDLGAIYTYLKTVKTINNQVVRFEPLGK
ncbi:MAG: c-type cytochrome [Pedobacter sp.]|nr:c-type cytochrome [Pedobacter sp.]MDQ8051604.1 c-type cytochrome [Pedobacter sp.]